MTNPYTHEIRASRSDVTPEEFEELVSSHIGDHLPVWIHEERIKAYPVEKLGVKIQALVTDEPEIKDDTVLVKVSIPRTSVIEEAYLVMGPDPNDIVGFAHTLEEATAIAKELNGMLDKQYSEHDPQFFCTKTIPLAEPRIAMCKEMGFVF